jgi:hypothetical protein
VSVSLLPRPSRSISGCPIATSRTRTCSLAVDWVMPIARAAAETLPSLASATSRRILVASQSTPSVVRLSSGAMPRVAVTGNDDSAGGLRGQGADVVRARRPGMPEAKA